MRRQLHSSTKMGTMKVPHRSREGTSCVSKALKRGLDTGKPYQSRSERVKLVSNLVGRIIIHDRTAALGHCLVAIFKFSSQNEALEHCLVAIRPFSGFIAAPVTISAAIVSTNAAPSLPASSRSPRYVLRSKVSRSLPLASSNAALLDPLGSS